MTSRPDEAEKQWKLRILLRHLRIGQIRDKTDRMFSVLKTHLAAIIVNCIAQIEETRRSMFKGRIGTSTRLCAYLCSADACIE